MLTGGATNRIPAVNAGGWSVSISHTQASTFARTAADKNTHRDNLKPIWGCYCDNGANSINFEAATRPIKASEAAATFRCPSYGPATRPPSVARTAVTRASSFAKATEDKKGGAGGRRKEPFLKRFFLLPPANRPLFFYESMTCPPVTGTA